MTKLMKFSLTALCVATLAACGSGSGSTDGTKHQNINITNGENNHTTQTAKTNNNRTNTNNHANTNTRTNTGTNPKPNSAPPIVTVNKNANVAGSGLKVGTVTQASVVVDGKTLSLSAPRTTFNGKRISNWGGSLNGVTLYFDRALKGSEYFGVVAENGTSQKYAFYGSTQPETSVMPTSGIANYEGEVIYAYGGVTERAGDATADGDAKLTVDFGAKKLTGTFDDVVGGTGPELTAAVNADISGSGFVGRVSTGSKSADLAGKFYGPNAASLAGVFGDANNQLSGAFAADKK